jgi:hypothetical protein
MQMEENVKTVCDRIIKGFSPSQVILFNIKHSVTGETKGFKICLVMDTEDKIEAEKRVYLDVDSAIPYDVLIYTPHEWDSLMNENNSFAKRITQEGTYVYSSGTTQGRH